MKIKFSHVYDKILQADGTAIRVAILLDVIPIKLEERSEVFLEYDTEGKFPLPKKGKYLMLIFRKPRESSSPIIWDANIFTTLRADFPERKYKWYCENIGETFEIEIAGESKQ